MGVAAGKGLCEEGVFAVVGIQPCTEPGKQCWGRGKGPASTTAPGWKECHEKVKRQGVGRELKGSQGSWHIENCKL